jgi:succinyl-CoA synthetase alpha subunit
MSIIIDEKSRVLVQGITGRDGSFQTRLMVKEGTNVVAGVTPGKGGTDFDGIPVFNTVKDAKNATGCNCSLVLVPAFAATDAIFEAIDAELDLVVAITEGIPILDAIRIHEVLEHSKTRMIGPNTPGIISPGKCKVGILPGAIFTPGPVGLMSRSGTLTYEIVNELTMAGLGQSTCLGVGGDPILGTTFIDVLPMFEEDPETEAVVLIGEIGGSDEEVASEYIRNMKKPVVAFISGRTAPKGKRMGHAGAIVSGKSGTAEAKVEALTKAGVPIADTAREIAELIGKALGKA